jgi:hypothetical protein
MNKSLLQILFLALFYHVIILAQPTIEVFTGLYYPSTTEQETGNSSLEKFWKPSINIGVCTHFQLANWVNLKPYLSYDYYLYSSYYQNTGFEERFVASSGEGSHIFRMMVALQIINQSAKRLKPYFEVGSGYIIESMGYIHGRWEYLGRTESLGNLGGNQNKYFAYSVGIGGIIYLLTDLNLDISARYYSNTTDRFYYLFGLNVAYNISN